MLGLRNTLARALVRQSGTSTSRAASTSSRQLRNTAAPFRQFRLHPRHDEHLDRDRVIHQRQRFTSSQHPSKEAQKACPRCGTAAQLNALSCSSCGALQPLPSELDAYQLLDLDASNIGSNGWDVDLGELKSIWRKRVALSHPDRMGGRDEREQKIAEQQSSMINKAYETLREPLERAHLLLEKHASSIPSEAESLEDPEVLMEVMELREGLEEAENEDAAESVRARNKERLDETIATLRKAFAQKPPDVETARNAAVGLRYWSNIDKAAREWQPGKRVELQH